MSNSLLISKWYVFVLGSKVKYTRCYQNDTAIDDKQTNKTSCKETVDKRCAYNVLEPIESTSSDVLVYVCGVCARALVYVC